MCGIYGIFRSSTQLSGPELAWLTSAQRSLQHRGPDGHQRVSLLDERCVLGHNRLSIIDLEGMFAFAIVDTRNETLFLARDRFGEKPLYWAELQGGGIAFASEMKALQDLPGVDRRLDVAALAQFLALGYIPAPRTHWQGVRKLSAGERIVL